MQPPIPAHTQPGQPSRSQHAAQEPASHPGKIKHPYAEGAGGVSSPDTQAAYWQKVKERALERIDKMRVSNAMKEVAGNVQAAQLAAADVVATHRQGQPRGELVRKAWECWQVIDSGPIAKMVSRALVCWYFVSAAYDAVEAYKKMKSDPPPQRWATDVVQPPVFPYLMVCVVLPAAILTAMGILVQVCGSVLLLQTLREDLFLTWRQLINIFRGTSRPTELLVKRFALVGAVLLVLAHSIRDSVRMRSYAGTLMSEERAPPSRWKSAALLVGRLLMTLLFMFVGWGQIQRIRARQGSLWQASGHYHYGIPDMHDNNWLLVEAILAIPFALGWRTAVISRVLSAVLVLEAFTCWPFWSFYWPSWSHRAHARLHFSTNIAMTGGLGLLQCLGPGEFTIDQLLNKKQE